MTSGPDTVTETIAQMPPSCAHFEPLLQRIRCPLPRQSRCRRKGPTSRPSQGFGPGSRYRGEVEGIRRHGRTWSPAQLARDPVLVRSTSDGLKRNGSPRSESLSSRAGPGQPVEAPVLIPNLEGAHSPSLQYHCPGTPMWQNFLTWLYPPFRYLLLNQEPRLRAGRGSSIDNKGQINV